MKIKLIAALLCGVLLIEQAVYAAGTPRTQAATSAIPNKNNQAIPTIPSEIGAIEDMDLSGQDLIYLIQDPHTNASGQRNVAKILEIVFDTDESNPRSVIARSEATRQSLREKAPSGGLSRSTLSGRNTNYVFLEAGSGVENLDFLKKFGTPDKLRRMGNALIERGLFQGSELFNITTDRDVTLYGVENMDLYKKGIGFYQAVHSGRKDSTLYLARIRQTIHILKTDIYSEELQSFDNLVQQKDASWLNIFKKMQEHRSTPISLESYPTLKKLTSFQSSQTSSLSKDEESQLLQSLSPRALHKELEQWIQDMYAKLIPNPTTRELHRMDQICDLLQKLHNFQLTPDEHETLQNFSTNPVEGLTGFLNRQILDLQKHHDYALPLDTSFIHRTTQAQQFYKTTFARDQHFINQIFSVIARSEATRQSHRKSVLITGGFHAPYLKKLFKKHGISYISIIPTITQPTNNTRYESLLLNQHLENLPHLPNIIASSPTLATTMLTRTLTQDATGNHTLRNYFATHLSPQAISAFEKANASRLVTESNTNDTKSSFEYRQSARDLTAEVLNGYYNFVEELSLPKDSPRIAAIIKSLKHSSRLPESDPIYASTKFSEDYLNVVAVLERALARHLEFLYTQINDHHLDHLTREDLRALQAIVQSIAMQVGNLATGIAEKAGVPAKDIPHFELSASINKDILIIPVSFAPELGGIITALRSIEEPYLESQIDHKTASDLRRFGYVFLAGFASGSAFFYFLKGGEANAVPILDLNNPWQLTIGMIAIGMGLWAAKTCLRIFKRVLAGWRSLTLNPQDLNKYLLNEKNEFVNVIGIDRNNRFVALTDQTRATYFESYAFASHLEREDYIYYTYENEEPAPWARLLSEVDDTLKQIRFRSIEASHSLGNDIKPRVTALNDQLRSHLKSHKISYNDLLQINEDTRVISHLIRNSFAVKPVSSQGNGALKELSSKLIEQTQALLVLFIQIMLNNDPDLLNTFKNIPLNPNEQKLFHLLTNRHYQVQGIASEYVLDHLMAEIEKSPITPFDIKAFGNLVYKTNQEHKQNYSDNLSSSSGSHLTELTSDMFDEESNASLEDLKVKVREIIQDFGPTDIKRQGRLLVRVDEVDSKENLYTITKLAMIAGSIRTSRISNFQKVDKEISYLSPWHRKRVDVTKVSLEQLLSDSQTLRELTRNSISGLDHIQIEDIRLAILASDHILVSDALGPIQAMLKQLSEARQEVIEIALQYFPNKFNKLLPILETADSDGSEIGNMILWNTAYEELETLGAAHRVNNRTPLDTILKVLIQERTATLPSLEAQRSNPFILEYTSKPTSFHTPEDSSPATNEDEAASRLAIATSQTSEIASFASRAYPRLNTHSFAMQIAGSTQVLKIQKEGDTLSLWQGSHYLTSLPTLNKNSNQSKSSSTNSNSVKHFNPIHLRTQKPRHSLPQISA